MSRPGAAHPLAIFGSYYYSQRGSQGWLKPDKRERAPHILEMIELSNQISNWVATEVRRCVLLGVPAGMESPRQRVVFVRYAAIDGTLH